MAVFFQKPVSINLSNVQQMQVKPMVAFGGCQSLALWMWGRGVEEIDHQPRGFWGTPFWTNPTGAFAYIFASFTGWNMWIGPTKTGYSTIRFIAICAIQRGTTVVRAHPQIFTHARLRGLRWSGLQPMATGSLSFLQRSCLAHSGGSWIKLSHMALSSQRSNHKEPWYQERCSRDGCSNDGCNLMYIVSVYVNLDFDSPGWAVWAVESDSSAVTWTRPKHQMPRMPRKRANQ